MYKFTQFQLNDIAINTLNITFIMIHFEAGFENCKLIIFIKFGNPSYCKSNLLSKKIITLILQNWICSSVFAYVCEPRNLLLYLYSKLHRYWAQQTALAFIN